MELRKVLETILLADNDVEREFKEIFINKAEDYEDLENIIRGINNGEFNPATGSISELIYYSDTEDLFRKYFNEIFKLYNDAIDLYGSIELDLNANNLVWFAFEFLTTSQWYINIENYLENNVEEK